MFTPLLLCLTGCLGVWLLPACLSLGLTVHLSPSVVLCLSVSQSCSASLPLALVKLLFNISTGRQSKATFSLSGNQHKHTPPHTPPHRNMHDMHTHSRTVSLERPCQPAVDGHSNKGRVHKQRARLFGLAGAKGWGANKMTWLRRRWGERSSVLVVFQSMCASVCVYACPSAVAVVFMKSFSPHNTLQQPFSFSSEH